MRCQKQDLSHSKRIVFFTRSYQLHGVTFAEQYYLGNVKNYLVLVQLMFIFEQGLLFFSLMNATEGSDMQLVKH